MTDEKRLRDVTQDAFDRVSDALGVEDDSHEPEPQPTQRRRRRLTSSQRGSTGAITLDYIEYPRLGCWFREGGVGTKWDDAWSLEDGAIVHGCQVMIQGARYVGNATLTRDGDRLAVTT